jgi:cytochrome o ubiquinol oxidase operon protein cyoD
MSDAVHGHHGAGEAARGESHGSMRSYLTGFILSVILTAIPFWLVMSGVLNSKIATTLAITTLAVVQIAVHMVYFLHMNTRSEDGWSILALAFTVILVVIALIGSLWIIYHLNANMLPGMDMSQMP